MPKTIMEMACFHSPSQPDYETPTDSSSPPDNVYHTKLLGWEVNPILGYWYGNYYGFLDVQVTVTDVTE